MGVTQAMYLSALIVLLSVAAPPADAASKQNDPFASAENLPADVAIYIHVRGASDIRRELFDRPIARWIDSIVSAGQIHKAWSSLATAARMDEGPLFDACFGRDVTLTVRQPNQWAVITEMDEHASLALLQKLKVRVREPHSGMSLAELPEQEILLARDGTRLVIGPSKQSSLFYEILPRLMEAHSNTKSLFRDPAMQDTQALGGGRIAAFIRHQQPLGGISKAVGDLDGDQLTIHHAARFENAPFSHDITRLTCDFSPAFMFEDRSLLALIQPTDGGDGPLETFFAASLGQNLLSQPMRANLGDRRLIVVSETEGRRLEKPVDLLNTTVVFCIQAKDAETAADQLDSQMLKITNRIDDLGKGSFLVPTPNILHRAPGEPREVDLSAASQWFTGGFPIMRNLSLSWSVAEGPQGAWFVIGSQRQSLDEVVEVLKGQSAANSSFAAGKAPTPMFGKFENCGTGNGVRIGRHLRSWSDEAAQFVGPARQEEFRSTIRMMSDLAAGMQTCRWQLARPSTNEMRLEVQIKLAPPESAR